MAKTSPKPQEPADEIPPEPMKPADPFKAAIEAKRNRGSYGPGGQGPGSSGRGGSSNRAGGKREFRRKSG